MFRDICIGYDGETYSASANRYIDGKNGNFYLARGCIRLENEMRKNYYSINGLKLGIRSLNVIEGCVEYDTLTQMMKNIKDKVFDSKAGFSGMDFLCDSEGEVEKYCNKIAFQHLINKDIDGFINKIEAHIYQIRQECIEEGEQRKISQIKAILEIEQ